jgi:SAM-dependent methyltransferase
MLTTLQYRILKRICPAEPTTMMVAIAYQGKSKLRTLLGDSAIDQLRGKVVIDFGCGEGAEAVELALAGAKCVIGIDIRESVLEVGRGHARKAGVAQRCQFSVTTDRLADVVVSLDAFEHFDDPGAILEVMFNLLRPGGFVLTSFGPTWFHPYGGHLVSVFPWAHLLFSEAALIRWRSDIRSDGATRFSEVEGGLNQMNIQRFERLVAQSPFDLEWLQAVPISKLRFVHCRFTREWTTSVVRAKLRKSIS